VADTNGTLLSVNPAWTETLGWSERDLLGKTADWLCHPDDRAKTQLELAGLTGGRKPLVPLENRLQHKGGSYRWLSWTAVVDEGRVYAVARDVTDLKNAEEQSRASRYELTQVSRQTTMGAMTASIAHEVNQPLAAIVANANAGLRWLAKGTPDLTEVRALLKRIVSDGHRAGKVIASIRSMFKDRGETSPMTFNDLICEVLNLVNGELAGHQISLQTEMPDGLPQVLADRVQMQQVLLNLTMNAMEAMSSVTNRERVLTVKSEEFESDHVLITLQDSGMELIRPIWTASLTPSLRRRIVGWGWDFRFVALSLNRMAASFGPRRTVLMGRFFMSSCRGLPRAKSSTAILVVSRWGTGLFVRKLGGLKACRPKQSHRQKKYKRKKATKDPGTTITSVNC
jgi:PAS domain S-box-containing protein